MARPVFSIEISHSYKENGCVIKVYEAVRHCRRRVGEPNVRVRIPVGYAQ